MKSMKMIAVAGIVLVLGVTFLYAASVEMKQDAKSAKDPKDTLEELKLFSKAMTVIQQGYVLEVKPREMLYQAVKGMLSSLDRYCEFFEPEKYKLVEMHIKGEYAGIGAILQVVDDYPAIRLIQPGSAAEKAGLQIQDKILKIDGALMLKKPIPDVATLLRGDADTNVTLHIWRESVKQEMDVVVKREKIEIQSVSDVRMVGKSLGYFRIDSFQGTTIKQVDKALKELGEKGMKALIIDLRNNDGGLMPQAVALAERFLPKGKKIVSVDSKIPEQKKDYFSSGKKTVPDYQLIILVNQVSASASEIFSACMQDHKRATIVGVKTYGKASVQSLVPLDDFTAMKLTTAHYLSPLGRQINGVGLMPDEVVESGSAGGPDQQVIKALALLKDYM